MKAKKSSLLEKILPPFISNRMDKEDKRILIESSILTITYLLSFGILSLGIAPQSYFFISQSTFSALQIFVLVFIFAVIMTRVIYFIYKEKSK